MDNTPEKPPQDTFPRKDTSEADQTPSEEAVGEDTSSELAEIYDKGTPPATISDDVSDSEEPEAQLGGKMTFLEHLDELRKRIMHSLVSVLITFVVAWIFHEEIFHFLRIPIDRVVDNLHVTRPTEPFTIYLKVSFVAALFLAIPYILFQVWLFIAPGLYRKEKTYFVPFLMSSTVLFLLGGTFAYFVVLPPALNFLLIEFGKDFVPIITAVEYFNFELIILIGMGAIFQMPVLVAFLSIFGMVTPRFLWKNFRYAFLLIVIVAAILSPTTDPFNLFIWSGPMVLLYLISIMVSWIFKRRRQKREEA